jgi:erythromycin esterase-like protein
MTSIPAGPDRSLLDRIGDARIVVLGEASHGTAKYYRRRALLSRRLIAERGSFLAWRATGRTASPSTAG